MDPIGIRNNNPGNIRASDLDWEGAVGEEGGFVKFDGPIAGGKALIKNLMAYNTKYGLDTVEGIINRWAPPSENNTSGYVDAVAAGMGVGAKAPLDMRSPVVLAKLAGLISRQENGGDHFDPEFFGKVAGAAVQGGAVDPFTKAYVDTAKAPQFTKAVQRAEALGQYAPVDLAEAGDTEAFKARFPDSVDGPAMYEAEAQRLAKEQIGVGFRESVLDSLVHNTVTAKLVELAERGEYDPQFDPMSEENKQRSVKAGIYGNDGLMNYVNAAKNAQDFSERLTTAQERQDLQRRMGNMQGLDFASAVAGQLIGGVADPVAVVTTMGLGAAVAAARGAAAAGRALSIAQGAGVAAAENIAVGQVLEQADNQRFSWGTLFEQGITGAAFGAVGGLLVDPKGRPHIDPTQEVKPEAVPVLTAAAKAVQDVVDSRVNNAWESGQVNGRGYLGEAFVDHSYSTNADDMVGHGLPLMGAMKVRKAASSEPNVEAPSSGLSREQARGAVEEPSESSAVDMPEALGYTPEPSSSNPVYRELHNAGVVTELRSVDDLPKVSAYQRNYGEAIPADAKAVYLPQEDRVFVFSDRLTAAKRADPSGLVMHEVGVHYGLERAVGFESYRKILADLDASKDTRVREAARAVPTDTPEHLRLEETLGYLVEKYPKLGVVQGLIAQMRNWLRDNVKALRGIRVTANDAIAYVRGSVEHARREGRTSLDLAFPYVWHVSPVKGIESLDLQYAGTGEGRSAFGFGHYVTSEKGTALDYRNKEAGRRKLGREDGGLFRLRVNAEPGALLDWDAPLGSKEDLFRSLGVEGRVLAGTGGDAYNALAERLGSQRAASEALHAAGVPGLRYQTGRTRGAAVANSNYVMFSDAGLSMEARYSRSGPEAPKLPLSDREQMLNDALESIGEDLDPAARKTAERGQKMLKHAPTWFDKDMTWAYSPGVALSASKSRVARIAGSVLFENSLGSGKRVDSVSMAYDKLQQGYRDPYLLAVRDEIVGLMSTTERLDYMFLGGARKAVQRISTQVAEERTRMRHATAAGQEYTSQAPGGIQRLAQTMDDQIDHMVGDGLKDGNPYAGTVKGSGTVGFMPQVWKWDRFADAMRNDPKTWEGLRKNFTSQYVEKNVDPVIKELIQSGADAEQVVAARKRLMEQVEHQVNTRMAESVRDPDSRTSMDSGKFETMAAELLSENFHGTSVTGRVTAEFRRLLNEKIEDRSRTEFDLLREVDGVRLLDFVEHDIVSTIQHTAHRFAGQNAMAKAGFRDARDFEALISLATKDGATAAEVEMLRFGGRAFGFSPMKAKDHPMLAALRNFTYAATMGKLGIANLADIAAVVTSSGVRGMFKMLGYGFRPETELVQMLAKRGLSLVGQDYRIHSMTADVLPNGRAMVGLGAGVLRVSQKAAQLVSYTNGSNMLQRMLHKGFLPVMAEDLVNGIRGMDGGMTVRRMADAGLDGDTVARIKGQLEKYEPHRKEGDGFKWESWDDQQAADKMAEAMNRITYQTFQRTLVGESAMWRSESAMGPIIGQFHNFGLTSMEKQLGRNLAINDMNTYTAMAVGMAWSSLLYYARLQAGTAGMSKADADEYMKKNLEPGRLATGTLTYFNMSGIAAEVAGVGEVLFGGNTYQAGSGPVAAMGYVGNLTKAANSAGNIVTGQEGTGKHLRNILRILPGGNSLAGTYYSNVLKDWE